MQEANEGLLKKALHIGCTITLSYCDENGQIFYACCEGFTSTKLRLRTADYIKANGKLSSCLFNVAPPFAYLEYQNGLRMFKQKENIENVTSIDQREARQDVPKQIKLIEDECASNLEQFSKLKGQSIFYGQTVQFVHQASNKYLSFDSKVVADYESDGWKALLQAEHGEETFFKFISAFSFQQETGGYIFDEDTVTIVSTVDTFMQEPGLHASILKNDNKRELNMSPEKKSFWKIKIFSKQQDDQLGYLSVFDVMWINFSEQNLNLVVQKYSTSATKYLKFEKGEDTEKYSKFVGDSNGMFVIENVEDSSSTFQTGGYVEWVKQYRLRHLTSNHYLATEPTGVDDVQRLIAVSDVNKAALFQFELIYATINSKNKEMSLQYMAKDSYFRLCTSEQIWFRIELTEPNDIYVIEGLNYIEEITIPVFDSAKKDENVFKLAKASLNDIRLTQYLLSCMKAIKRSDEYLDVDLSDRRQFSNPDFQIKYRRLMTRSKYLEACLNDLTLLCYNKLTQYVSFDSEYGATDEHIQNLLKEQQFFETLTRILILCFPTQESLLEAFTSIVTEKVTSILANNQTELLQKQIVAKFVEKKKAISSCVYRLICAMCDQNQSNQQYCSKYLPIFALQSMYLPGAMTAILVIIKDYEELLLTLNKDVALENIELVTQMKTPSRTPASATTTKKKKTSIQTRSGNINYAQQYQQITGMLRNGQPLVIQWDLIMFFCSMLKLNGQTFEKKIEIMQFLKQAAILEGKGININQELAYKYILGAGDVFEQEILVRLKSDGPQLKVYRNGDENTLLEYYHQHRQGKIDKYFVPYICESMQMYSMMCNSRNYTWKKFAENFFNVESLIENIQNDQYQVDIRSIICIMLNKLYVDQEPRRVIVWPELCKIVRTDKRSKDLNNTMMSEGKYQQKEQSLRTDPVDLPKVKEKILGYLSDICEQVESNCQSIILLQGPNEKRPTLMQIYQDSPKIYNNLSLEVVRLLRLLINFGKYPIRIGSTAKETMEWNAELFKNIKCLVALLEFNVMYPEIRKILVDKRIEDAKEESVNIFGSKKAAEEIKVKALVSGGDEAEDPSQGETFQKQAYILTLKCNEFMYKQHNQTDTLIKLEICEILNQYLDSKMDFYLNNLKIMFSDWVIQLQLFDKIYREDLDIDDPNHRETIREAFMAEIVKSIQKILPAIMKSGTSCDDTNLKKGDNQLFAFVNVVREQKETKQLEAMDLGNILAFSVFPSLISIFCMNQDLNLETRILALLTRLYNQRFEFADLSSKLLILFDDTNINIFKKCKKKILVLGKHVDEAETWVQNLGADEQNVRTLISVEEHFEYFTELLFKGSYIDDKGELERDNSGAIDSIRQDIMRHMKLDKLGVDLIKDSVFMVDQETDPDLLDKLKGMFRKCLRFLTLYVKGNATNQMEMSKHITALVSNLNTDLGQVELLCEIFRNNKKICVERCAEVIDDFIKLILTNGRQSKFLEFFLIVMQIKQDFIAPNQKAVLNLFIDPRFKNQLFYMLPPQQQRISKAAMHPVFDFEARSSATNPYYRDEPYSYHARFVEVCAACSIGKEGLLSSENKLKAQITFKYIMELLLCKDQFSSWDDEAELINFDDPLAKSPELSIQTKQYKAYDLEGITRLKPPLLDLVYYTYLESEKISEEIFKCFGDINNFIQRETLRIQTLRNPRPEYTDYLFTNIMLTINGFIKVFNRELGAQAIQAGSTLQKQTLQFQTELEQLRNALNQSFVSKFKLSKRQETLLDLFINEAIMQEEQNKPEEHVEQLQNQPSQKKLPKRIKTIVTSKRELSIDQIWKELWNIFLAEFLNSEQLQEEIAKEQILFAKAVYKVEEIFKKDKIIYQQISKDTIFKRMIAFLEKSSAESQNVTTFKLILKALQNYINITDVPEDKDEDEIAQIIEEQKIENQNFLNCNNAMQMTLTLLSDDSDPVNSQLIFNDLICFAIDLLDGGNVDVQASVWSFFQNFTQSEVFFVKLHNEFQSAIRNMNKVDENQQLFEFQKQSNLIHNILRLLQLFAEGHYSVLQEYMHDQYHNHHSYDLIQDFIDLLGAYMNAMNPEYFENMIQNFDTITEFIQGPCRVNQQALIKANFLDLANQLLGVDEILADLDNQLDMFNVIEFTDEQVFHGTHSLPRWMYAMLKYKCSVTLISLLEARGEDEIVQRMMKSLNQDILKMNMNNTFYMFQMDYNQVYIPEIFNHFALPTDTVENQEQITLIMETGFNLYFIYTIFQKVKNPLVGRAAKGEDDQELSKSLKDNPLWKLVAMVQSIVQSIQDSAMMAVRMALKSGKSTPQQRKDAFLKTRETLLPHALKFYKSKTANIEIMLSSKNLEEVYFYIPPYCQMDDEAKTKFNESAKRASNKSKVTSLQTGSTEVIKTMKINYQIQLYLNKFKILQIIIENLDLLRDIEFLLALAINILIFLFYMKADSTPIYKDDGTTEDDFTPDDNFEYKELVDGLGILSIVLSILIVAFFLSRNAPLLIEKAWDGVGKDKLNLANYLIRLLKTIYYLLSDFFALYYIMYGAAAVLGRFLHPFFFAFHLFEVMIRFPVLLNVIKSVWLPRRMILYTGLLLLIFMYVFSVFGYLVLYDSYEQGYCDSMWVCFLTTLNSAFKYDSGIGGLLMSPYDAYPGDDGMLLLRFIYDNFFNILVLIVMLNIVSGIIIDTFGELREELAEYRNDLDNYCFICGHDKETIEKESVNMQDFADHLKYEHYQYNYLFYIAYILDKDPTEYTGVESYVAEKIQAQDITWFPLNKALCLKKDFGAEEVNPLVKHLEEIKNNSAQLQEQLQEIIKESNIE